MLLVILLAAFGVIALTKKEFSLTRNRKVSGQASQTIGIILLVGAALAFFVSGLLGLVALGIAIVYGYTQSSK